MHTDINNKDLKVLFNQLKSSAKKRNIEFNLSVFDLYELSFPITCPILGIPLFFNRGKEQDNSYSIDRKDSTKGYNIDNIIVISNKANKLKNDATTDQLNKIASFYSG